MNVYVQGDLGQQEKRAVFLTVHDLGTNHTSFHDFVEHPSMAEIKERSVFIHVDVPGQDENCADLGDDFQFPTMQALGEDLITVLDTLHVKYVIALGEGAGANILLRFGIAHPGRSLGLILIHCTTAQVGVLEYLKDKFINWKLTSVGHNPTAEQYLVLHKFGHQLDNEMDKTIHDYQDRLRQSINPRNLKRYVEAFMNRRDVSLVLKEKGLKVDTLLVVGGRGAHVKSVQAMYEKLDKTKTQLLKIDDAGDVINDRPEKFAQSLLLFCKGLGLLTSCAMPGERQRTQSTASIELEGRPRLNRAMSMEEYDKPNIRRLSITLAGAAANKKE